MNNSYLTLAVVQLLLAQRQEEVALKFPCRLQNQLVRLLNLPRHNLLDVVFSRSKEAVVNNQETSLCSYLLLKVSFTGTVSSASMKLTRLSLMKWSCRCKQVPIITAWTRAMMIMTFNWTIWSLKTRKWRTKATLVSQAHLILLVSSENSTKKC